MGDKNKQATTVAVKDGAEAPVSAPKTETEQKSKKKDDVPRDYSRIFVGKKPAQVYIDAINRNMDQPSLTLVTSAAHSATFFFILENYCCFSGRIPDLKMVREPQKKYFIIEAKLK